MYRFRTLRRLASLVALTLAAACGDGVTEGQPGGPGKPGPVQPDTTTVVASVEIDPGTLQLRVETSRALSATVRSRTGTIVTGRMLTWTSSDPTVVRVDINGNATALKVGTAVITAATDGKQGQSTIQVTPPLGPPPVQSVHVIGTGMDLEPGEAWHLGVELRAADGQVLHGRQVAWSTSDSTVVRVFPTGEVLGLRGGTATITATSEGKQGTLAIVIPPWLQFDLSSVSAQGLPAVVEMSADTTDRTEHSMVVTQYRERLVSGRLWLSTMDSRYRQRYEVQTWKQTITLFQGNSLTGPEQLVGTRIIQDEGRAELYDVWTGEPIYESTIFAGHSFRASRTEGRGRLISQRLPGATEAFFDLRYTK